MTEYQDRSAINKLLGEDRADIGLLGRALREVECGTLLFDEFEKAHPLILDVFLQMLWNARVTVATGETFRLASFYLGFTSNIGGADATRMAHSSFSSVEQAILRRVEQTLRPELVGRIDEKLVFARLSPDVQREICELEVRKETERLRGLGYDLEVSREAIEFLIREGFHPHLGARPLRKTVERHLQDAVVRRLFAIGIVRGRVGVNEQRTNLEVFD